MAEIKSAIELAMEKTKGMGMDERERESFARKDIENRIRAILRRYYEEMTDSEGVQKELGAIEGDPEMKKGVLFDLLIEGFDVKGDNDKIFSLFHLAGIGLDKRLGAELEELQRGFAREMEKRKMIIGSRIEDKLKKVGIGGNGVEPNIEAWDEWQEAVDDVAHAFSERLEEWKKRLAEKINNTKQVN
ncbi:MAG TPA: hypothetical protein PLX02_11665 [Syntrophorhabdaceae bacterium]|nr:hypothetical protein [Syntrophorhabdaceae bacterium]HQM82270.1 hypothetical protein [Syntrophorhabdaceae bacterium]